MHDLYCTKYLKKNKYKKPLKYIFSTKQRKNIKLSQDIAVLFAAIMISQFWLKPWLL